ncbi:MAG: hypothetical protein K6E58_02535 [Eubacterium sp.]|nr:hypothetical protein [Eubacterium sp.]
MKKQIKRILVLVCTLALAVTGITFTPVAADEEDDWIHCENQSTVPDGGEHGEVPSYTYWRFESTKEGGASGNMDYYITKPTAEPNDYTKLKFRKNYSGIGSNNQPLELEWAWDQARLYNYGSDHGLVSGRTYNGTIVVHSTADTEVATKPDSEGNKNCRLRVSIFGTTIDKTLKAGDNIIKFSDVTYDDPSISDKKLRKYIAFNLIQLPNKAEISITSISMEEEPNAFIPAPPSTSGYVPSKDGVNSLWTLYANNNGVDSFGRMGYRFSGTPSDLASSYVKVYKAAHDNSNAKLKSDDLKQKKRNKMPSMSDAEFEEWWDNYDAVGDPDAWWFWNKASLVGYLDNVSHLVDGHTYIGTINVEYTQIDETHTPVLRTICNGEVVLTELEDGNNTITIGGEDGFDYVLDEDHTSNIDFNLDNLDDGGYFRVTSVNFVEQYPDYTRVPSNVDYQVSGTPWTLRANYVPEGSIDEHGETVKNGSYGVIKYKVDTEAGASKVSSTEMLLKSTVGVQETNPDGTPIVDPAKRWWWSSGVLKNYAATAGFQPYTSYKGTITFKTNKPTAENCHLFVYVDGKEYSFSLHDEENVLTIPEFQFNGNEQQGGSQDIKFLFDELPSNSLVSVTDISFEQVGGDWTTVPNEDADFTVGPWNMFGMFDAAHPEYGHWGVVQYQTIGEDPQTYADYKIKAASVSGWDGAWACFARLKNYCADHYDFGDPYDITLTINSSKSTEKEKEDDPEYKMIILVGRDLHYVELEADKDNIIRLQGENYQPGTTDQSEQIMLEMDCLKPGTVLQVKDIKINNGPNEGWTTIPNKKWTSVGPWSLNAKFDETHWSKLAYKENSSGSGISAYDFRARRVSEDHTKEASMACLNDYLRTKKDTEGYPLNNDDPYNVTVKLTASGLDSAVTDYGKVWININGTQVCFDVVRGTNTYDLKAITGDTLTYKSGNAQDIDFEFDELRKGSVINVSEINFIPLTMPGTDVPNGQAIKVDGTPWTLYAITNSKTDQYGELKYAVEGDPSELSSLKVMVKSASGWFPPESAAAAKLIDYLTGLKNGKKYRFTIKANIDETNAIDNHGAYDRKLQIKINDKNFNFDLPEDVSQTQTFTDVFTYDAASYGDIEFHLDQLLKGTIFSVESIEIVPVDDPTTQAPTSSGETTTAPHESTTVNPSTPVPTTSETPTSDVPTSDVPTTVVPPTGETTTGDSGIKTTANGGSSTKAPGKTKIKKVYKKKKSAKKLKLKLKKVKRAKGYQVNVYKSKKKAKKNKKAIVRKYVKYKKKITIKSKKLKNKKKLYVRARAYVLDTNKVKIFGKWSNIKKVKIK